MAALPSSATATVWTAARRAPKRELMTPVARNNWKVSAGMRNRSSRNGTAAFRLPKNVSRPGQRNSWIFRHRHRRIGEPSSEQNEADRQQLAGVGKIERRGHDHVGQRVGGFIDQPVLLEQFLACLDENRQDDEQIARHEGGDERVARRPEHFPIAKRGKRRRPVRAIPTARQATPRPRR